MNVEKDGAAIVGTQTTFQAADTINGNNHTNLQLKLTDTGTAAWTAPAATVNGIQTVSLQNANGTAAVAGVTETGTVTAVALNAGETVTVAGQTLLATTALTAAQVASALAGTATSGTGFTLAGTLSGWTKAAGSAGTNTVVYTSTTATAPVADLVVGGTAQTGAPQVNQITVGTAAADNGNVYYSFTVNGSTVNTAQVAGNSNKATQASAIASAINAYLGRNVATADGVDGVALVSSSVVSIGAFNTVAVDGALTTAGVVTNVLAPQSQTVTITTDATATTGTFTFNGVSYTTATAGAATVTGAAAAFVAKINEVAGATIASNLAGVITINYGGQGAVINNFAYTGSTFGYTNVVASSGVIAATPLSVVEVQGVAPVAAQTYLDTLHADQFVGATNFISNNSTGAVTVDQLATGQTTQIQGNGSTANGNLVATYLNTATGAATVNVAGGVRGATVTVNGATGQTSTVLNSTGATNSLGGVTATGATLTVNANSALSTGGVTNAALTAIAVSGAAANVASTTGTSFNGKVAVDLGALGASVKTVDASGLTAGGVYVGLNNGVVTSFKGGQGNDIVATGNTTNSAASIDAGAGSDTLIVGATNDISTNGSKYLNFEVLQNNGTASLNASKVAGITSVISNGNGAGFTNLTAAQAAAVSLISNQAANTLTYALTDATGTSDVLGLTVSNTTATTVVNATNLAIGGFETLNLTVSTGGTAIFNADGTEKTAGTDYGSFALNTDSTDLKTVTVAGANAAKFDISSNATKVTALNASSNTSGVNLKIGGQTGALVVTGTAAADLIEVGTKGTAGSQTLSLGTGNDTVKGLWADLSAVNSISAADGTDTLASTTTTATVTVVDSFFANVTGVEKFTFANTSGALSWTVGGYANSLVTSTGGTLDIAAKALTTGGATIDATGLTGGNLLKLALTSTGDTLSTVYSSASGADSITMNVSGITTNTKHVVVDASLNTSAGVTIDLSGSTATAGTANVAKGGSGADTIKIGGTGVWLVTGGAGRDALTANAISVDKFIYTTAATSVGDAGINVDTVTGFVANSGNADLIALKAGTATLLRGVTIDGTSTSGTSFGTTVADTASVNSLADVYAAITANGYFGSGNFAGSAASAGANQLVAKQITFANGSAAGTYLVVNDAIAGFQGAYDLVVKIGVTTGTLGGSDIVGIA